MFNAFQVGSAVVVMSSSDMLIVCLSKPLMMILGKSDSMAVFVPLFGSWFHHVLEKCVGKECTERVSVLAFDACVQCYWLLVV